MRYKSLPLSVKASPRRPRPTQPSHHRSPQPRRLRDWLATIPLALLLPALVLVSPLAEASSPSLVAPERALIGEVIALTGEGFPRNTHLQLLWNGTATGMPSMRSNVEGRFAVSLTVPGDSDARIHLLQVVQAVRGNAASAGRQAPVPSEILASASLTIIEPDPTPAPLAETPAPTAVAPTPPQGDGATPVPESSAAATPLPSPSPAPTAPVAATAAPTPTPADGGGSVPTANPTPSPTPAPAMTVSAGIWLSQAEITALPASGAAWDRLVSRASSTIPRDDLSCQDASAPQVTMAAALVAARSNDNGLRGKVRDELTRIIGTEDGSTCGHPDRNRPLGVGRNLTAYVISADLIGFRTFDPAREATWRAWLSNLRSKPLPGGWALSAESARADHSNWGAHQAAALTAANAYLGDATALAVDAAWARAWVDVNAPRPWVYHTSKHDYSWSSTGIPPRAPVNPSGAVKDGVVVDGIPLVDMQRGGGFTAGQPTLTNYPRESLVGRTVQFELLHRQGYPAYGWGDRGLLRVAQRLLALSQQWESGWYEPRMNAYWILAARYGVALPRSESAVGRQVIGVDWSHRGP
jgi:hypothetical protein